MQNNNDPREISYKNITPDLQNELQNDVWDTDIANLVDATKGKESSFGRNAGYGDGGKSYGSLQYSKPTFEARAKGVLGGINPQTGAPLDYYNNNDQKILTYSYYKLRKQQGYNPEEIVASHNNGDFNIKKLANHNYRDSIVGYDEDGNEVYNVGNYTRDVITNFVKLRDGIQDNNGNPIFKQQETQPQETQPQETQPQETQPQETQPQETQPQETQPQETQPQETQPPIEDGLTENQRILKNRTGSDYIIPTIFDLIGGIVGTPASTIAIVGTPAASSAVGGAIQGAASGLGESAQQLYEKLIGKRRKFDFGNIGKEAGIGAAVGAIPVGGPLIKAGRSVGKIIGKGALKGAVIGGGEGLLRSTIDARIGTGDTSQIIPSTIRGATGGALLGGTFSGSTALIKQSKLNKAAERLFGSTDPRAKIENPPAPKQIIDTLNRLGVTEGVETADDLLGKISTTKRELWKGDITNLLYKLDESDELLKRQSVQKGSAPISVFNDIFESAKDISNSIRKDIQKISSESVQNFSQTTAGKLVTKDNETVSKLKQVFFNLIKRPIKNVSDIDKNISLLNKMDRELAQKKNKIGDVIGYDTEVKKFLGKTREKYYDLLGEVFKKSDPQGEKGRLFEVYKLARQYYKDLIFAEKNLTRNILKGRVDKTKSLFSALSEETQKTFEDGPEGLALTLSNPKALISKIGLKAFNKFNKSFSKLSKNSGFDFKGKQKSAPTDFKRHW